jgi:hypothetical protein
VRQRGSPGLPSILVRQGHMNGLTGEEVSEKPDGDPPEEATQSY